MKISPQYLVRAVEQLAAELPKSATPTEIALALSSPNVGCVPLRLCSNGRTLEPVPVSDCALHDPWALATANARDVKRQAARWAQADAVGVCFPHGGPDYVLGDNGALAYFANYVVAEPSPDTKYPSCVGPAADCAPAERVP